MQLIVSTSIDDSVVYGVAAKAVDNYVQIGKSTGIESLKHFCNGIIEIFGPEYLRSPSTTNTARLLAIGEVRGFLGMLGSLDCMHWEWKYYLMAWQGQYVGHQKKPTIILEAVASYDLLNCHEFFGMPGSHNDLNVLNRSPLFYDLTQGKVLPTNFIVNGHTYNMDYYLADGIYAPWATLVQTISSLQRAKKQHFYIIGTKNCKPQAESKTSNCTQPIDRVDIRQDDQPVNRWLQSPLEL
ncbi:uncharacterized protein LOC114283729 [Camellia sinensis]|uniref:uncharacterized protein LOC114283729 n=1 Tax=Camellia sinensis TaxID=4442 RepID=UPI0010355449|nr:uncharacterized protein LOC114283729 [Camellia sinensis]